MDFTTLRIQEIHGVVKYDSGARYWNSVKRADHIVGLKRKGSARHNFADKSFLMAENCAYFINQREDYQVEVYEPGESFSIHFTTDEEITTESFCFPVSNTSTLITLLQKAEIAELTGNHLALFSLVYQFCEELMKAQSKVCSTKDRRLYTAREYIDLHFTESSCLKNAICESGLGERRFRTLFQSDYGVTPNKYVTLRRIEHAKGLLSSGNSSVAQAASRCGFSSVYYFSKVFKAAFGITPSEYRKNSDTWQVF
ncbi:MAG: helix-turn-helix transcriptional regulator [Clostridia bacterium]|nr:helix-turn-helix transcriptional regulator [Clostridia bacterium]